MKINPYVRNVYYYETDKMGIVHHSNYIRWLEEARLDYMSQCGITYEGMEEEGIMVPVLGVSVQYKVAFRFGDAFKVYVKPTLYNGVKFQVSYEIWDAEDTVLHATGSSEHCFCDDQMNLMSLKKRNPEISMSFHDMLSAEDS